MKELKLLIFLNKFRFPSQDIVNVIQLYGGILTLYPLSIEAAHEK